MKTGLQAFEVKFGTGGASDKANNLRFEVAAAN